MILMKKKVSFQKIEQMLETELTEGLGYDRYDMEERNSGITGMGITSENVDICEDTQKQVLRDRNGEFHSELRKMRH